MSYYKLNCYLTNIEYIRINIISNRRMNIFVKLLNLIYWPMIESIYLQFVRKNRQIL